MNTKLVRIMGEDVICDLLENNESYVEFSQPIVAVPLPQEQGKIGFAPWSPLMSESMEKIRVSKRHVVYVVDINDDMKQQYEQLFNRVITSPKQGLIL